MRVATGVIQIDGRAFGQVFKRGRRPDGSRDGGAYVNKRLPKGEYPYTLVDGTAVLHCYHATKDGTYWTKAFIALADLIDSGTARIVQAHETREIR